MGWATVETALINALVGTIGAFIMLLVKGVIWK